jgi:histidinol-phosphatase (PHP family)
MWDLHMHCRFSGDSEADPEAMIASAMEKGLDGLCFTDHEDIDYPKTPDDIDFLIDFDAYYKEMTALKQKYEGRFNVLMGVELGLQEQVAEQNAQILKNYPFDMAIGSIHVVHCEDPYYPAFYENRTSKEAFREYFEATLENIKVFSDFDVLGHLGYIIRYAPGQMRDFDPKDYMEIVDEIFKYLISHGKGIEINSSGYKSGLGPLPCKEYLLRYKELGGEIITTGADAHKPEDVAHSFDQSRQLLLDCGFKHYTVFKNRKAEFYPL